MTPADRLAPESWAPDLHAELVEAGRGISAQQWFYDGKQPEPDEYEERSWR